MNTVQSSIKQKSEYTLEELKAIKAEYERLCDENRRQYEMQCSPDAARNYLLSQGFGGIFSLCDTIRRTVKAQQNRAQ
jgi:elongation factor P--beta-lysine ligase